MKKWMRNTKEKRESKKKEKKLKPQRKKKWSVNKDGREAEKKKRIKRKKRFTITKRKTNDMNLCSEDRSVFVNETTNGERKDV